NRLLIDSAEPHSLHSLRGHTHRSKCIEYLRDGSDKNATRRSNTDGSRGSPLDQAVSLVFHKPHQLRQEVIVECDLELLFNFVFRDPAAAQTLLNDSSTNRIVFGLNTSTEHGKPSGADFILPGCDVSMILGECISDVAYRTHTET